MSKETFRPLLILVDDEPELLDVYQLRLKSLNCEIKTFNKPQEFVAYLKENPQVRPDLVISDFNMPGMTGVDMIYSALQVIKDFPSILLSGYIDKEKAINANNRGVWHILEKPANKEQLLSLAKKLLIQSRIMRLSEDKMNLTAKLTELFTVFRMLCMNELELSSMNKPIITASPNNPAEKAASLEEALNEIQEQLKALHSEEQVIMKELTTDAKSE